MKIVYGANYGRPSLDLNFARNKSLIDTISGQNLVTFTRSQTGREATYVGSDGLIKYASANEPRFDHNPLTGECLGLLIEESRSNFLTLSEQFDDGIWLKENGANVLSNSTVAPDGTFSADTIVESTSTTRPRLRTRELNVVNGSSYVFSFYVKSAGRNFLQVILLNNTTTSVIDISTGQYVSGSTNVNVSPAGNGWFRVSIWGTFNQTSGNYRSDIFLQSTSSTSNYTGDGVSGVHIWGAQLEAGSFPTSYIPTSGSTVTRSADVASITGTNFSRWYNNTEGTVFFDSALSESVNSTPSIVFGNYLWATSPNVWRTLGNQTIMLSNSSRTTRTKHAFTLKSNDHVVSINGGAVSGASQNNSTSPASSGPVSFNANGNTLNGYISRLTYYSTRLQNYQLQQLTK